MDTLVPQFKHDCERCRLVHQVVGEQPLDIYVCPVTGSAAERHISTVIARHGDEGDQYGSGLEFAMRGPQDDDDLQGRHLNAGLAKALRDGFRLPRGLYGKVFIDFGWDTVANCMSVSFVSVRDNQATVYVDGRIKSFSKWG